MKKSNIEIMLSLFAIGILVIGIKPMPVKAEPSTIYVDDDNIKGPWDGTPEYPFRNITWGLSYAASGDTIYVYTGIYVERLTINEQIFLVGQDKHTTTIDGNLTGTVLKITASGVTITGFTIANAGSWNPVLCGIYVENADDSRISNNIVKYSYRGIRTVNSSNNIITNNEISNNQEGIYLVNSNINRITDNTISANNYGIVLKNSNNSMIFHNNYIGNKNKSASLFPDSKGNSWDNGVEGNYWDEYLGEDSNRDGIGDTPLQIPPGHQDNFPLMGIYSCLIVSWQSDEYQLSITSNSTISQSGFNETFMMISFSANGPNGTVGFCRIAIPNLLVNKPYAVIVDGEQTNATALPASNSTITFLYFTYLQDSRRVNIFSKPYFELQEKYDILFQEYENMTSYISELAKLLGNLTTSLENLTILYNNLSARYTTLENQLNTLETNYTSLQSNYSILQQRVDNLTTSLENLTILYNNMATNYTSLRTDYYSLQYNHNLLDEHYRELSDSFAELVAHNSLLQQNYESLQNETNDMREEYLLQNANFSQLETKYADLKSSTSNLTVFAVAIASFPSLLAIASLVESRRQRRIINEYKRRMDQLSPLSVARERFETDVERRKMKVDSFQEKYGITVRPSDTLEKVIGDLELKKRDKK